jgi:hypothetical protein
MEYYVVEETFLDNKYTFREIEKTFPFYDDFLKLYFLSERKCLIIYDHLPKFNKYERFERRLATDEEIKSVKIHDKLNKI